MFVIIFVFGFLYFVLKIKLFLLVDNFGIVEIVLRFFWVFLWFISVGLLVFFIFFEVFFVLMLLMWFIVYGKIRFCFIMLCREFKNIL